jgi:hypothetical protein
LSPVRGSDQLLDEKRMQMFSDRADNGKKGKGKSSPEHHMIPNEEEDSKELNSSKEIYGDDDTRRRVHTDQGKDDDYSPDRGISNFRVKSNLATLKLNVPLNMAISSIFQHFSTVAKRENFQIIEMEQTMATAVNKEPISFKRMFFNCLPFQSKDQKQEGADACISAVRLQISFNDAKNCRKVIVKGLYGNN